MIPNNRRERWNKAIHDKSVNIQIASADEPTIEEGFVSLTIIDHKGKHHQFVATHSLKEFLNRQRKFIEYFSTDSQGRKTGVSLEWRPRDKVFVKTSDQKLHEIRKTIAEMVKENPAKAVGAVWHGDHGAGMFRDYDNCKQE